MSIVFVKEIGSSFADKFRGTHAGPTEPPGIWEKILTDKDNANIDLKIEELQTNKRTNNHVELKFIVNRETVSVYKVIGTTSYKNIKDWITQTMNKTEFIQINQSTDNVAVAEASSSTVSSNINTTAVSVEVNDVYSEVKKNGWVGYPILTSFFMAGCIAVGLVGGNLLSEKECQIIDTDPLLFENFDPKPINETEPKNQKSDSWDERPAK